MNRKSSLKNELSFISFCLEEYKNLHGMDGASAAALFEKYGVMDYLMEHYEILHSFSAKACLAEIDGFLKSRRAKK